MFAVNEKKVIAVIVEGPSDEAALGSILKEYFSSAEIQLFETAVFIQLLKVSSRMGCNLDERIKDIIEIEENRRVVRLEVDYGRNIVVSWKQS